MYTIYTLFSLKDKKLYCGYTNNLERRLKQHSNGDVISTKDRRPLKLIHFETYRYKSDAERREKYLKGGNGRAALKIQLKDHLTELGYRFIK